VNGAEALIRTLVSGGVDTCFMNPGTSEIHFVAALDRVSGMRGIPCLFEGVASGAADGYARMAGKPACTLFHLGPGLSNALANLHNAYRAHVPLVNIAGDHATYHRRFDAPLTSDIEAIVRPYSAFVRTPQNASEVSQACADAIAAAHSGRGQIATLILPADAAWSETGEPNAPVGVAKLSLPDASAWDEAAALLRNGAPTALLLGPHLIQGEALVMAGRIAAATGAKLLAPFAFGRMQRGVGLPAVERIPYVTADAIVKLAGLKQIILIGAGVPAAFFAHPDRPSLLLPQDCKVHELARVHDDCEGALEALADALGARQTPFAKASYVKTAAPHGAITLQGLAEAVAATLPEQAIVIDESITSGRGMMAATQSAVPHDWLVNTGGSIGIGLPLAVGAAVACPERPVLCLEADGSALYTLQALWTAAREKLRITTIVFANRAYAILKGELAALGDNPGPRALEMLDIGRPDIDFVALSKALGIPATRATTLDELVAALHRGLESGAPNLIEVPL
jgi:acetolactate synthase-1/2/3 large subunit